MTLLDSLFAQIPFCAPKLNQVIKVFVQDVLGLAIGSFLAGSLAVTVLVVVPAFIRACAYNLYNEIVQSKEEIFEPRPSYRETRKRYANIVLAYQSYPLLSPLIMFVPLLLVAQFIGKPYVGALAVLQFVVPVVWARTGVESKSFEKNWVFLYHAMTWFFFYYIFIFIIIIVEAQATGLWGRVLSLTLNSATWWASSFGTTFFALVLVSDLLFYFLTEEGELDEDRIINEYLAAVRNEAAMEANMPLLLEAEDGSAQSGSSGTPGLSSAPHAGPGAWKSS